MRREAERTDIRSWFLSLSASPHHGFGHNKDRQQPTTTTTQRHSTLMCHCQPQQQRDERPGVHDKDERAGIQGMPLSFSLYLLITPITGYEQPPIRLSFQPQNPLQEAETPNTSNECLYLGFRPLLVILYLIKKTRHTRATGVGFRRVTLSLPVPVPALPVPSTHTGL